MGNTELEAPSKVEKVTSPMQHWQEHGQPPGMHAYPDWAVIQAYYGHGVGLPHQYFSSAVAPAHSPHPYMWGPQPLMPPYGTPYAPVYSPGGFYALPSISIGPHAQGHGISSPGKSDNAVTSPLSMETPAKSSGNKSQGFMKKLKGFDGLAVSIGNGEAYNAAGDVTRGLSQSSTDGGAEGSSDGSEGNSAPRGNHLQKKRCSEDMTLKGKEEIINMDNPHGGKLNRSSSKSKRVVVASTSVTGKPLRAIPLPSMQAGMDFRGSAVKANSGVVSVPAVANGVMSSHHGVPSEISIQDERELKRERRKQSNRESARRSRLRKQAETEEFASRVESLNVENMALKTEIERLSENLENLRREHSNLKEKLKDIVERKGAEDANDNKTESEERPPVAIQNLLSRVNNSGRVSLSEAHETSSGGKFHQLLESKSRADAVAAS